ncbi:MAG: hypothetical protein AAF483_17335, partial [Planctomycetota bacterium]
VDHWLQSTAEQGHQIAYDIEKGQRAFLKLLSSSDGFQCTENKRRTNRHLSNTVFNVMRGGIPIADYDVDCQDFREHIGKFNKNVVENNQAFCDALPEFLCIRELKERASATKDADLERLTAEYLPLAFSRRHGDPTRPWNRFAIHLRSDNGKTNLNYQGNWRDIFQNWEALSFSFPDFSSAMICRFVNATTADGYNPYRVTKDGFEWEEPTPGDPWANIGYWGDHQIIYLLKLLEWNRRVAPQELAQLLDSRTFVHANVPYRIKDFESMQADPQSTIDFDQDLSRRISQRVSQVGADGKLLTNQQNEIHRVTLLEKLLTLSLAKFSNFIPDGGIWLNTQRPEWNDANNALVGNGLSMVTTCYLYRWCSFLADWLNDHEAEGFALSREVAEFAGSIHHILSAHLPTGDEPLTAETRAAIVRKLSVAGANYRNNLYSERVSGEQQQVARVEIIGLLEKAKMHLEVCIRRNRREDGLYHAYNLLEWREDGLYVQHFYEMLEGQVAVLSSGLLSSKEALELLDALRESQLYRANQASYMLYPDRQLPRFMDKNIVPEDQIAACRLLQQLLEDGEESIVKRDVQGTVHFDGNFKNESDLRSALLALPPRYQSMVFQYSNQIAEIYENIFNHREFTGRSGTFFAYEGLGSIYWHMVSKLNLAVAESISAAIEKGVDAKTLESLKSHFQSVRAGVGSEKTPTQYGAFPTDPYSHTPENAGVKQPGMTGQVKEDILSRFAELGLHFEDGQVSFRLELFDDKELLSEDTEFQFYNLRGEHELLSVPAGSIAFTLCQVPITYRAGVEDRITVHFHCDSTDEQVVLGRTLGHDICRKLFSRSGEIHKIECEFQELKN